MKVQLSVFATLALTAVKAQADLAIDAYGTNLAIPAASEVEYDQNQNHAGGLVPTVENGGSTLHVSGNRWSAYPLGGPQEIYDDSVLQFSFTLNEETDKGFQAVCLDADLEHTGDNGMCFVLSTSQGWVESMMNVAEVTAVNQTSLISIPVGHFFTGPINYLAILQDSDGTDRSLGDSTFTDIKLIRRDRIGLEIEINGQMEVLENNQLEYRDDGQDTRDWLMEISEDGKGLQINGNNWKALALPSAYNVSHYTVLEFDIVVDQPADFHSVCLDDNLSNKGDDTLCVTFKHPDNAYFLMTSELETGVNTRLVVPYGQILGLLEGETEVANYLVIVQDEDSGDKRGGRSTMANIRLYEGTRTPLNIDLFGQAVSIPNIQVSFTNSGNSAYVQDSIDHVQSVSADGSKLTAYGNSYKRFKLDVPFTVSKDTVMKFHFEATHEAEGHFICLLDDSHNMQDGRNDCFAPSGKEVIADNGGWKRIYPQLEDGEASDYEILVGTYFTGEVLYFGFGQDNDAARAEGESSISNITISSSPSIKIGVDGSSATSRTRSGATSDFTIEGGGNQVSYESSSQDNTPIRDYLAAISEDGDITATGNMWRAFPITPSKSIQDLGDFVVSFTYTLKEEAELHAVCFEDNLEYGDYDDPADNQYDPRRCVILNAFQDIDKQFFTGGYYPALNEPHRYVLNLSKFLERFYNWNYLVILQDNDLDRSVGEMTIGDFHVTTSLSSCLKGTDYDFQVQDCTIENFLGGVQAAMATENTCTQTDPLLELMALFDAKTEIEVYKKIENICASSYKPSEFDFASTISSEPQLVKEFIDGGTVLNYESDDALAKDGAGIAAADSMSASHLFAWPKHHALDQCDVGAAMCCWVDSRGTSALVDNTDVCYVNMKDSRRTAHVADGYSIYGGSDEGAVNCHGFAWGTDGGSINSALKGNALFKVGFMDNLLADLKGNVEQVPGAPMCGCIDRMPVVTEAKCTKASADTSTVNVAYVAATGTFNAVFTLSSITYSDCGDLNAYYKELVGADTHHADYIDTRIVGEGQCTGAINDFLSKKGLVKS